MQDKELLKTVLENIQTKVSSQVYNAYFSEIDIQGIQNNSLTISCKNVFTKQVIESRYFQTLLTSAKNVTGIEGLNLNLIVTTGRTIQKDTVPTLFSTTSTSFHKFNAEASAKKSASSFLNPKYTFETYIVGAGSQLAHAAALAIADNPGNAYNPFFVYGNVGLGKTHLMQAIGHEILRKNPDAKVLYCSTESFLNEMVNSIRTQKTEAFRSKYRALDALILDDIQFISNKERLQEEFFNTFNTLYQSGKQIIIASDRPPSEIAHLEDRVRSRFEGGLVADIKSPDTETRAAILQKKLMDRNEYLPDAIIYAVAESVDSNIRELEGALLKVSIYAKTKDGNITLDEVRSLLGDKVAIKRKKVNPLDLMETVCEYLEVELKDVKSQKRNYDISFARQICMYLLKDVLHLQLIKIAKHVGRKDHTTVMHGISKIEKMIQKDTETSKLVSDIRLRIT